MTMLTKKRSPLSNAGLIGLVLAISMTFCAGVVLARATSLESGPGSLDSSKAFAGTWYWMFQGKRFSTMILTRSGSGFKGSVTQSRIKLNDDGELSKADPSDNTTPQQISKATLEGSTLHVKVMDGFEFTVTLVDETHAQIRPIGAPANMQPIHAEKAY
jgi:hypothetical protein